MNDGGLSVLSCVFHLSDNFKIILVNYFFNQNFAGFATFC